MEVVNGAVKWQTSYLIIAYANVCKLDWSLDSTVYNFPPSPTFDSEAGTYPSGAPNSDASAIRILPQ
jgi:hypothetical protein